jgi:antitoxin component YwqK of YwqJK toxin-antitoxin module
MSKEQSRVEKLVKNHKDGSLWATGQTLDGLPTGYWEWFRKDGTKLRSGYFEKGEQTGEWTTYDRKGEVYKVTTTKQIQSGVGQNRSAKDL